MYQNTKQAKKALKRIESQKRRSKTRGAINLCVYRCAHCSGYHLGRDER